MTINLNEHGYAETRAATPGEFVKLPSGGYICLIVNAEGVYSKNGNPMLVLNLEIVEGEFKGYFADATKRTQAFNPDKRWDNGGVYRQGIFTQDKKISPFFKGLLTVLMKDNPNIKINFDAFNPEFIEGATLGFVFAEEEYDYNGHVGVRVVPKFPKSIEDIRSGNFKVPELKSKHAQDPPAAKASDAFGGTPIPDDESPF